MKAALKILVGISLLALTLWLLNLAAYNTWAAFLSHRKYPANEAIYASRSNTFFVWTCITGAAFLIFSGWNLVTFIRHRRPNPLAPINHPHHDHCT